MSKQHSKMGIPRKAPANNGHSENLANRGRLNRLDLRSSNLHQLLFQNGYQLIAESNFGTIFAVLNNVIG